MRRPSGWALLVLAIALIGAFVGIAISPAVGAEKKPSVFVGYCEAGGDAADGTCVLDEPEGQNTDTYGVVTYGRVVSGASDELTITLPSDLTYTEAQVCVVAAIGQANPYVPTHANTCAGSSPDRVYASSSPSNPITVALDAALAGELGYAVGGPVWFTVHVVAGGRTLAVTGGSAPGQAATRSLTVTKDFAPDDAFLVAEFTLDCRATSIAASNTTAENVTFGDGNAVFALRDGEAITFTGLVDGDGCTVRETTTGYITKVDGELISEAYVVLAANRTVAFENVPPRMLSVMKRLVGSRTSDEFLFTIDCGDYALSSANAPGSMLTFHNGDVAAMLGDGDLIELIGIPPGTTCTVEEEVKADATGTWSTTIDGLGAARKATVVLDRSVGLVFRNGFIPNGQSPPPDVATPQSPEPAQVLGVTVERESLAATGADVAVSVIVAIALFVFGVLLVAVTAPRRRAPRP